MINALDKGTGKVSFYMGVVESMHSDCHRTLYIIPTPLFAGKEKYPVQSPIPRISDAPAYWISLNVLYHLLPLVQSEIY